MTRNEGTGVGARPKLQARETATKLAGTGDWQEKAGRSVTVSRSLRMFQQGRD